MSEGFIKYIFIVLISPILFFSGATAQETGAVDTTARESMEKSALDSESARDASNTTGNISGNEAVTADIDKKETTEGTKKAGDTDRAAQKTTNQKKDVRKTQEKKASITKKEEPQPSKSDNENNDEPSGDVEGGLLLVEDENFMIERIPGITLKKVEEPSDESIVRIPDDSKLKDEEKKGEGFLGCSKKRRDSIAGWGLLIFIVLLFVLYKSRSKRSSKKVVRSLNKR